jgi:hypothetical protein
LLQTFHEAVTLTGTEAVQSGRCLQYIHTETSVNIYRTT